MKERARRIWRDKENEFQAEKTAIGHERLLLQQELADKQKELSEWMARKDPVPPRSEPVRKNREKLKQQGISFYEFYKTVDFAQRLSSEQQDRLEEALVEMGILDALIVSADDRDKVLYLDRGMCDKYIFSDVDSIRENLQQVLEIDNPESDILFYQQISKALSGISYQNTYHTAISEDGHYQLGVLTGTITGEYRAKYIGVKARVLYKQQQIEKLQQELRELQNRYQQVADQMVHLEQKIECLAAEFGAFPPGEDLKIAVKDLHDADNQVQRLGLEIKEQEERVGAEEEKLRNIQGQARAICEKLYLPGKLNTFTRVNDDLEEYKDHFVEVQLKHASYCEHVARVKSLSLSLDDIDGDLDELRYDLHDFERKVIAENMALESIREQLKLTNYEEIKERLDIIVRRLQEVPILHTEALVERTNLENVLQKEAALGYVHAFTENGSLYDYSRQRIQMYQGTFGNKTKEEYTGDLQENFHQNKMLLTNFYLTLEPIFGELETGSSSPFSFKRLDIKGRYRGNSIKFQELMEKMRQDIEEQTAILNEQDRELFEDILANTISKKIRAKIYHSQTWVEKMNALMGSMVTSSGLTLSLRWKSKQAEYENQLDTSKLVALLKKDADLMKEEEFNTLSAHFRSKIQEARQELEDTKVIKSFHVLMREVLDYRKWFEFQLESKKTGELKKELTDRVFFTFSGGEKAMAMYVPLFSAVVAKYQGGRGDAPRLISLDEAFAGVDEMNIRDMFRLMVDLEFDFMVNSQILWGDYDTVPGLLIYQLIRPENVKYVTVLSYLWNGQNHELIEHVEEVVA